MLKLMRAHPQSLKIILNGILKLLLESKISMPIGETFPIDQLFEAHKHLQSRKSIGKIAVKW
jgi:NADPH:quinone reductase-like Zn-dependent oxidoreductase